MPDHVSRFDYTLKVVRDASVNEVVLITVAQSHDLLYAKFLLNLGEDDALTERVLLAAAQNGKKIHAADFIAFVERSSCDIIDFVSIMHAIRMNQSLWHQKRMKLSMSSIGSKHNNVQIEILENAFQLVTDQASKLSEHLRWNALPSLLVADEEQMKLL